MLYDIVHDIPGRLRIHCRDFIASKSDTLLLPALLATQTGIIKAKLSVVTNNLLICYSNETSRNYVLHMLDVLHIDDWQNFKVDLTDYKPANTLTDMLMSIAKTIVKKTILRLILPQPVGLAMLFKDAMPYLFHGFKSIIHLKMDLALLDSVALTILALRKDYASIRTIIILFGVSETLEEWIKEQSRKSLAEGLELKIDKLWIKTPVGEKQVSAKEVKVNDLIVVRAGSVIPVDGTVAEGEAMVNQAMFTGESAPVHKFAGVSVFAGTVIEEGSLVINVDKPLGNTRIKEIIEYIEQSSSLKAGVQNKAEQLADKLVPYCLLFSLAVLAVTRDPIRAASVLMVDFSCAIKMSTPLTILSAIQEGVKNGVVIKGGKYLEELATIDTVLFDKTGTLTNAKPVLAEVITFKQWDEKEALRVAACIEEHFPHPVARAIVNKAVEENIKHKEKHAEPEYIVAHGITTKYDNKKVTIGSSHFIFEDNKIPLTEEVKKAGEKQFAVGRSLLYLAYENEVAAILAIEDPIRKDAQYTIDGLAKSGFKNIVMLTGDSKKTAKAVAEKLNMHDYRAGLLPINKAEIVNEYKNKNCKVMFVGDGINDSPALSAADIGVSMADGADIAKEVADLVLTDGKISDLVTARELAEKTMVKIHKQFEFIIVCNSILMGLGLFGLISPKMAALFHNLSTVLVGSNSLRPIIKKKKKKLAVNNEENN